MDDLVGIAAEQKVAGSLQGLQHQRELHRGDVLHLVNHHEVVTRRSYRVPFLGDQVQVEELRVFQPGTVLLEQVVELVALVSGKNRLAHAQRAIILPRQHASFPGRNDAANFLKGLMPVDSRKCGSLKDWRMRSNQPTKSRQVASRPGGTRMDSTNSR